MVIKIMFYEGAALKVFSLYFNSVFFFDVR